nr:xylulose kinase-1 [Tanacetum cinerariifolium]
MSTLKFADTHNMVVFLSKPTESEGFKPIVDFMNAHPIRYALTINPTIYISCIEQFWSTAMTKTINEEVQLHAKVDDKKIIITESSVRRDLRLADKEAESVGIKSLLDVVGITAAQVYVNTALKELVLLVNFNEKYTKCLLLLVEVETPCIKVNAASES